jgi:hypothetical protein
VSNKENDPTYAIFRKAAEAGEGCIYLYGCPVLAKLKEERDRMVEESDGERMPDIDPFFFQYDLELFCFLFYDKHKLQTGIPRSEHFWRAVEIRWPTSYSPQGRPITDGQLHRNPWGEKIVNAACKYRDITIMGGSGQGKTTTPIAIMLMVWEFFAMTPSGARAMIASVSETKLEGAAWSALLGLMRSSKKGISRYVGVGIERSSMQVLRPDMQGETEAGQSRKFSKDRKGIIDTALVGGSGTNPIQVRKAIDKLTGKHVPTAMIVILDEYQSMPDGPEKATSNLFSHPEICWLFKLGNPSKKDDPLGKSGEPLDGWKSVTMEEEEWEVKSMFSGIGICFHFDNDKSPGMVDPVEFHYLPTQKKKDNLWSETGADTPEYSSFWRGWFPPEGVQQVVIPSTSISHNFADEDARPDPRYPIFRAASMDTAPASLDRTPLVVFSKFVDRDTRRQMISFDECILLPKKDKATYYRDTARDVANLLYQKKVPMDAMVYDNCTNHGIGEELRRFGVHATGLAYQGSASKKPLDLRTGKIAYDECYSLISEAAVLLSSFIWNGMVRGLTEDFVPNIAKELCLRRWQSDEDRKVTSKKLLMEDKKLFRIRNGFSPDVMDCLLQAAWYARHVWGMVPGMSESQLEWRGGTSDEWESSRMEVNSIYDSCMDYV